ncbi:MAG: efflux RND transporter permease subunit, partial [Deltaproteobacteria bacterium]
MIDRLLEFSVRQRALVLLLACVFVVLGTIAASRVPIDAVPDVTGVQVQVLTPSPALGAVDVETYVTFPIETAMGGLPGVTEIRSMSRSGISVVTVVFRDDVNVYFARQLMNERLADARERIPRGYGTPTLGPISTGLGEVFHFEVRGNGQQSLMELRSILEWQIVPRLRLVPGIIEVNTFGGEAQTFEVELDPQRLASERVDVSAVLAAIDRNNAAAGGAYLVDGSENVNIRGDARVRSLEDLASIVVDPRNGAAPLYLRDLGVMHMAPRVRYGAVTRDGEREAVVGVAMMLLGENSGQVVARVKDAVADISRSLPPGVRIDPYYDRTELVHRTIRTVGTSLLEASTLVIVVLFLTLGSLRTGSLVALAIPLALIGAFIGMYLSGVSGNLLSLGAIDFGLVVDGAIIIVENAQRRLAERRTELGRTLTESVKSYVPFIDP